MTNQEKKAWLKQYRDCGAEVERLEDEIQKWESLSEKMTSTIAKAPGGGSGGDRIQHCVESIDKLKQEQCAEIERKLRMRCQIKIAIDSVQEERLRLLLGYRYINGNTWEQIAVLMDYSYRQITRMHGEALSQVRCP